MKLILHQLGKDVRQHGSLVVGWVCLLTLDAVLLLLPARVTAQGQDDPTTVIVSAGTCMLMPVAFAVIASLVVLGDTPARGDRFLATRPFPGRSLVAAKLLFLVVALVAPAALQEGIVVLGRGVALPHALHAAAERLLAGLLLGGLTMSFAALWRSAREWFGAALGLAAAAWLSSIAVHLVSRSLPAGLPLLGGRNLSAWAAALGLAMAAITGLTRSGWPRRATMAGRTAAVGGICLVALMVATWWPWDFLAGKPDDRAEAMPASSSSELAVPLSRTSLSVQQANPGRSAAELAAQIHPALAASAEPGTTTEWFIDSATATVDGQRLGSSSTRRVQPLYRWQSTLGAETLQALNAALGPDAVLITRSHIYSGKDAAHVTFPGVEPRPFERREATLDCLLRANIFRWERVAGPPLTVGAEARSPGASWRVLWLSSPGEHRQVALSLCCSRLLTAADPELQHSRHWPRDRYLFVLWSDSARVGVLPDNPFPGGLQLGLLSAAPAATVRLRFESSRRNRDAWAVVTGQTDAKLLIFQKRFVGTLSRRWTSGRMFFTDSPQWAGNESAMRDEKMSRQEFSDRLRALPRPAPDAPRAEVGRYVYELLTLLEAHRASSYPESPAVHLLLPYVATHPEALLDGLLFAQGRHVSRRVLKAAISRGLDEHRRDLVISRLFAYPDLATIILERGWLDAAHDELFALLERPGSVAFSVLRGICWFEDPSTYPRLLEELERDPNLKTYELLRELPEMEPLLAQCVDRIWARMPRAIQRDDDDPPPALTLAMRSGDRRALLEAYARLAALPADRRSHAWRLLDALEHNIILAGLRQQDRHDETKVAEWLMAHRPEDLHFDPVRRRFRLAE